MKFIFGLQAVSTIFIIALTGITNSKVVRTHFPNVEWNLNERARRQSEDACTPPKNLPNSRWLPHDNAGGDPSTILELSCNDGYGMHFDADIFCDSDGDWSHKPQCIANEIGHVNPPYQEVISSIFCSRPSDRDNGHWRYRKSATLTCPRGEYCRIPDYLMFWGYGAHLHQMCDAGYENRAFFYCQPNIGRWVSRPTCVVMNGSDIHHGPTILAPRASAKVHFKRLGRASGQVCNMPSQPRNGHYRLETSRCQNGQQCEVLNNHTLLYPGDNITLACNNGYKVDGIADVFCKSDGELSNNPECIEIQCNALSTDSTTADCAYNNTRVSCASPVRLGTIATVSCRETYRPVTEGIATGPKKVTCVENGEWNQKPLQCSPECGKIPSVNETMIVGGRSARIAELPWHATLYKSTTNGSKEMICGATIIQRDLLITAAHCVVAENPIRLEEANTFFVATGNVFRDFDSSMHQPGVVQKANVERIAVNHNYMGYLRNYDWDIAILKIEQPFTFSAITMPACLDLTSYSDRLVLEPGHFGKLAGFGRTATGLPSRDLQMLEITFVSLSDCQKASKQPENESGITPDKFCAEYKNGSAACDSDGGAGLVFKSRDLWYVRGVSNSAFGEVEPNVQSSCKGIYTLFTKITTHGQWIQAVIEEFGV